MRTTLDLDDDLVHRAQREAARSGRTLSAIIEYALREVLARPTVTEPTEPYRVVAFPGQGLRPVADLDDSAALGDLMDGHA